MSHLSPATYMFAALPGIARLVDAAPRLSEDELYKESLRLEPRGLTLAELEKRDALDDAGGDGTQ